MTILVGAVDAENERIIMGTDTLWTWPVAFTRDMGLYGKVVLDVPKYGVLMTGAGGEAEAQIVQAVVKDDPKLLDIEGKGCVIKFAWAVREALFKAGHIGDPATNALPVHEHAYLLAHGPTKTIYMIDDDYTVTAFDGKNGVKDYIATGCGHVCAEPVMDACKILGVEVEKSVRLAIDITKERDNFCGYQTYIKCVPFKLPEKSLKDKVWSFVKKGKDQNVCDC